MPETSPATYHMTRPRHILPDNFTPRLSFVYYIAFGEIDKGKTSQDTFARDLLRICTCMAGTVKDTSKRSLDYRTLLGLTCCGNNPKVGPHQNKLPGSLLWTKPK